MKWKLLTSLVQSCAIVCITWLPLCETQPLQVQVCSTDFDVDCDLKNKVLNAAAQELDCQPLQSPFDLAENQVKCYKTCAYEEPPFFFLLACDRCLRAEGVLPVSVNQGVYNIFRVRSSGARTYDSDSICDYHAKCSSNQNMFYILQEHELEAKVNNACPDALTLSTDAVGTTSITCGEDFPKFGYSTDSLYVNFHTNGENEFKGFSIIVFCVNTSFNFRKDCKTTPRRDRRMARGTGFREKRSFPVPTIRVNANEVVRYEDFTLTVMTLLGELIHKFENIQVLQVYDGDFETFIQSAAPERFYGPGKLHIGKGIAQYIETAIEGSLLLSREERMIINRLVMVLSASGYFERDRFTLPPLGPPGGGAPGLPGLPGPPSDICDFDFSEEDITMAEENLNNCNGFVGAAALFFLTTIEPCMPTSTPVP